MVEKQAIKAEQDDLAQIDIADKKTGDVILSIKKLNVRLPDYADRRHAIKDLSLQLYRGEILCVIGESGSGKSMLASVIMRYLPKDVVIDSGDIIFKGRNLAELSVSDMASLRGKNISMVFQEPLSSLNPSMKIGAQVEEVFQIHSDIPKAQHKEYCLRLFEEMKLPDIERIYHSYPHQLSGGQCQRVIIAMALALEPDVLIADEPTTALDVTTQASIIDLFHELKQKTNRGIIFITHDCGLVAEIADRVAVMENGVLVECGDVQQILNQPQHSYTKKLISAVPSLKVKKRTEPKRTESKKNKKTLPNYLLDVRKVNKIYGTQTHAAKNINLTLEQGKVLTIVGESGSGKSTLAKMIVRLENVDNGQIFIDGKDIVQMKKSELLANRRLVQMIFQDPNSSLNPKHNVGQIIGRGAMLLQNKSRKEAWAIAMDYLEMVGLERHAVYRKPHEFSGGQRQRIAIARALALQPKLLIADEAVSALDVSVQKLVLELLADLQKRLNLTVLFITHDLRVAAQISDFVAVMNKGEVVENRTVQDVLGKPSHSYTKQLFNSAPGRDWVLPNFDD